MIPRPSDRYRKPGKAIVIPDRVAERAATKYETSEDGCWISTYSVASHGYAQIGWQDAGYYSQEDHDLLCVVSPSTRVGIPANNIPHVKKKMGGQTFGQVELGMPRHHKN